MNELELLKEKYRNVNHHIEQALAELFEMQILIEEIEEQQSTWRTFSDFEPDDSFFKEQ